MNNKFIITGFPRSRTAWIASLFNSHEDVICFHEPINRFSDCGLLKMFLDSQQKKYVGISDSSVGAYSGFYIHNFDCPFVVVRRNRKDAIESYCNFLNTNEKDANVIFDYVETGLDKIVSKKNVLEVDFNKLNDMIVVKSMWNFCINDYVFDEEKCNIFQGLIINQHTSKIIFEKQTIFDN